MHMTYKTLASKIDELRKEQHVSQMELGALLGITQASVSRKLNGQIPFSAEEIFECAERFNVSTEYLYGREKKKTLEPV